MSGLKLNLKAKDPTEERILDYLKENASAELVWKINTGKKTLGGCVAYLEKEAKKQVGKAHCVCVDDATVFGWVIHYFEEDDVKESKTKGARVAGRKAGGTPAVQKKEEPLDFGLFAGLGADQ